jgi:hypothetical protein
MKPKHASTPKLVPMKATIYQYACIALIAICELLDDEPRHVSYREEMTREERGKGMGRGDVVSILKHSEEGRCLELDGKKGKESGEQWMRHTGVGLSAMEKRDAWVRIRGVTPRTYLVILFFPCNIHYLLTTNTLYPLFHR